jgi:hypothetical protein
MPTETATKKGECYKAAFDSVQELVALARSPTLIHGWVTPLSGPCAGKRIRHAWVEMDGCCYEVSNGQLDPYHRDDFYNTLGAEIVKSYSPPEARSLLDETGHYGRWDADL